MLAILKDYNEVQEKKRKVAVYCLGRTLKIRHFRHVVVVQRRQRFKEMYKKRDALVELLFCQAKPITYLFPFSLKSPSSLRKLPIISWWGGYLKMQKTTEK